MQCVCRYLYLCILHIDIIVCMCNVDVTMLLLNLMPVWFLNIFLCLTSEFLVGQQHTRQWRDVGSVWMSSVSVRCRYMQHCSTGRGRCQLCSTCHAQSAQAAWPRPPVNTARNVSRVILSSGGYFLRSLAAEYFLQVITSGCAGYC